MADITVTPASVVAGANAITRDGIAGETITAGQTLYLHSDGKLYKALSDTALHAAVVGIALNGGAINQPIEYVVSDDDLTIGATVAAGVLYFASNTAGGIAPAADISTGEFVTFVGIGISTTKIKTDARVYNRSGVAAA